MRFPRGSQYHNMILAALPRNEITSLAPHLSLVNLELSKVLHEADQSSEYAYFVETGIASLVSTLQSGDTVEVGVIGREGFVGLPFILGTHSLPFSCFMQVAGHGYRIKSRRLEEHFYTCKKLRERLLCSTHSQFVQMGQIAVCNRVHDIGERLARWLLTCHDRIDSDDLILTHEFLATMLAAPRSTVTLAAGILQQAGCIEYTRGHIHFRDRKALEEAACECYRIVRKENDRLHLLGEFAPPRQAAS